MKFVDVGKGAPVILVPGVQGRWEWMRPAVDALSSRCRVVTFSLADEPTCGGDFESSRGFDCYVAQIRTAMDLAGLEKAVVAGVSYGGLIAATFAARYPQRTAGLVLVSAIPPHWKPNARIRFYLRAPRLLSPLFLLSSLRLYREISAAIPGVLPSMAAAVRHGLSVVRHRMSPARMARRVHLLEAVKLDGDLTRATIPTLLVTGDSGLDTVVPVQLTREYMRLWPHAEHATLPRTGHLGLVTRPEELAAADVPFVERQVRLEVPRERKVG